MKIENNRSSIYCRDMLSHIPAGQEYPVWVFLEVITFGRFLSFLKFCADYFDDDSLRDDYYMMKKVKSLRNAAGHSNCILNDLALRNREDTVDINDRVVKRFCRIVPGAKYEIDHKGPNEIQNDRLKELVTLFSMHSKILPAPTMKSHWHEELESFLVRALRHYDEYYKANPPISNTIQIILKMVQVGIDIFARFAYNTYTRIKTLNRFWSTACGALFLYKQIVMRCNPLSRVAAEIDSIQDSIKRHMDAEAWTPSAAPTGA